MHKKNSTVVPRGRRHDQRDPVQRTKVNGHCLFLGDGVWTTMQGMQGSSGLMGQTSTSNRQQALGVGAGHPATYPTRIRKHEVGWAEAHRARA